MVRFKNRYLLVELCFSDSPTGEPLPELEQVKAAQRVSSRGLYFAVRSGVERYFGDTGIAACTQSLAVKYYSPELRLAIVRAPREAFQIVSATASLVTNIRDSKVRFVRVSTIHVGGTIRSTQKAALRIYPRRFNMSNVHKEELLKIQA